MTVRRALTILFLAGLAICCALWMTSYFHYHHRIATESSGAGRFLCLYEGSVQVWTFRNLSISRNRVHVRPGERAAWSWGFTDFKTLWKPGLSPVSQYWGTRHWSYPLWGPTALFACLCVGMWIWHWITLARRSHEGMCLACGYDLRGSEGRCPECGAQPDVSARA